MEFLTFLWFLDSIESERNVKQYYYMPKRKFRVRGKADWPRSNLNCSIFSGNGTLITIIVGSSLLGFPCFKLLIFFFVAEKCFNCLYVMWTWIYEYTNTPPPKYLSRDGSDEDFILMLGILKPSWLSFLTKRRSLYKENKQHPMTFAHYVIPNLYILTPVISLLHPRSILTPA